MGETIPGSGFVPGSGGKGSYRSATRQGAAVSLPHRDAVEMLR